MIGFCQAFVKQKMVKMITQEKKNKRFEKEANKNRNYSTENSLPTFVGSKCRICATNIRYTKNCRCCNCFYDSCMHKDLDKRKIHLVQQIKRQATHKGLEFNLTVDDIDWVEICPILDYKLDYFSVGGRKSETVSFDRKDPNVGYIKGNVFIISNRANSVKSDMSLEQIKRLLNYVGN